jgi:hypothetical protein
MMFQVMLLVIFRRLLTIRHMQEDGTAFAEIKSDGTISYLGRLPQQSVISVWREMKSYREYMLIGSEAANHGVQFFDMKKLLDIDPKSPKTFSIKTDLAGFFNDLPAGRSHNVVVVSRCTVVALFHYAWNVR